MKAIPNPQWVLNLRENIGARTERDVGADCAWESQRREGRPPPYVPTCAQPISADSLRLMINVDEG